MSVTIPTKDVGDVQDKKCCGLYKRQLEDGIEEYIKKDLGVCE